MKVSTILTDKFEKYLELYPECTLDEFAAHIAPEYGKQYTRQYIHQQLSNTDKGRMLLAKRQGHKRKATIVSETQLGIEHCNAWLDKIGMERREVKQTIPDSGDVLVLCTKVTVTIETIVGWESVYLVRDSDVLEVKIRKTPGI